MKGVSVYSFRNGMDTLTQTIEANLRRNLNVEIVKNDGVATLDRTSQNKNIVVSSLDLSPLNLANN